MGYKLTTTEENGVKIYHYEFGMVSDGGKGFYEIVSNRPLPEDEIRKTELECDEILGNMTNNIADEINKRILDKVLNNGFSTNHKMVRKQEIAK